MIRQNPQTGSFSIVIGLDTVCSGFSRRKARKALAAHIGWLKLQEETGKIDGSLLNDLLRECNEAENQLKFYPVTN